MIFSLFEQHKPYHKIQLKNSTKVIIGSHTDLEYAFQIGNFMNMLYQNIKTESKTMTNSVVVHNLLVEFDLLAKYCTNDNMRKNFYEFHRNEITKIIDLLIKDIDIITKLTSMKNNIEHDPPISADKLIEVATKSAYGKYFLILKEIMLCFPHYFYWLK